MQLRLFVVDAFTRTLFRGNPAAVCPLDGWLPDALLQNIATENNLSETAFFVPEGNAFRLRWFTPTQEVDLCGHATLATAHVLFRELSHPAPSLTFLSRSGELHVTREGERLTLDFPAWRVSAVAKDADLTRALGREPTALFSSGRDYLALFESEQEVAALSPDMERLRWLPREGVMCTAPGESVDFVSRYFAPQVGIPEDPVTGSAHCSLAPLWAERLGKSSLSARQISPRGGELSCRLEGERVLISGHAVRYLEGTLTLPDN
jgi:PhzF family phenazine biosynthesis protein